MQLQNLLIGLVIILAAAKLGGELMERLGQTAVLGELLAGVVIGPGVFALVRESKVLHALADLGQLQDPAASVVLGSAVVDDILGLLTLAVVTSIAATGRVSLGGIAFLGIKSVVLLVIAVLIALRRAPVLGGAIGRLQARGALVVSALVFALTAAWRSDRSSSRASRCIIRTPADGRWPSAGCRAGRSV
jgi:Kef-type K+ transport system membrane component KefB